MDTLLADYVFSAPYINRARDACRATGVVTQYLRSLGLSTRVDLVEMLIPLFFRGQRAYAVGRLWCEGTLVPLVFAFQNEREGISLDAVLCAEDDVSVLFSFTRAYFHVDVNRPHDLVRFIHRIIPQKRLAELYIAIGYNRHGKTELYRDLLHHLQESDEQFVIASGARGMVMLVFTFPSFDVVFKIIRDSFDEPKRTTRADVMGKYTLVFRHDRAGRLIDAQEFEYLEFDRARFSEPLLAEMQKLAAQSVRIDSQRVVIKHLYAERRVHPLDLYVRQACQKDVRAAVIDYGFAIKDLAAANIFPGDILLKNFGVTRHGRVVFYDYDELCLLTECNFRETPVPRDMIDEMSDEPWYYVGEHDCFPAELKTWLGLAEPWRGVFIEHHADLYGVPFWRDVQSRIRAGELIDILPYSQSKRLDHRPHAA
jgi:isocitrate dehydrogenase kinase/phosphatase